MSRRNKSSNTDNPRRQRVTNINQLGVEHFTVVIQQGEIELEIPMRTLTYGEWIQVDQEIPNPDPPSIGGPKGLIYDRQAPAYLRGLEDAAQKRMLLRLARSLDVEGITGATPEEEITCLRNHLDNTIINALGGVLQQLFLERNARIEARANSFHPVGSGHSPDM